MELEQSFLRTEDAMTRSKSLTDMPPSQAGLSAALRRAFTLPASDGDRQFEELLRKLA